MSAASAVPPTPCVQQAKYNKAPRVAYLSTDYKNGFLTQGLFKFTRHPNFFAEQCFWVGVFMFSVAATQQWLAVTGFGAALLITNFHFSTNFSEVRTPSCVRPCARAHAHALPRGQVSQVH